MAAMIARWLVMYNASAACGIAISLCWSDSFIVSAPRTIQLMSKKAKHALPIIEEMLAALIASDALNSGMPATPSAPRVSELAHAVTTNPAKIPTAKNPVGTHVRSASFSSFSEVMVPSLHLAEGPSARTSTALTPQSQK